MKMAVVSLGCAKNLVDTEIMLGQLVENGWELTNDFVEAELILLNTCGFIESAKKESVDQILELAEYKKEGKGVCHQLVVAGCLVQRYLNDLKKDIPEVDHWIGLGEIDSVVKLIQNCQPEGEEALKKPFLNDENLPRYQVTLEHTAFVKIAEGCNHCCSYCAIPIIKGGFRSRQPESIIVEIKKLVASGVKEINLIAQDITMYGYDLNQQVNLVTLLKMIIHEAKPQWLRLLYAYPSGITSELLQLIADEPTLCKYLDVPFQHINERILKLMNRPDSPELLKEKIALIRQTVPEIVLRTTFIVGFPSETDQEFMELLQFVKAGLFDHVGVFTYSKEEQTKAFGLKPQIKETIKEERKHLLLNEQQKISSDFLKGFLNTELIILIDKLLPDGRAVGRTAFLAPEIDGVVYMTNYTGIAGQFVKGRIIESDNYNLTAEMMN